MSSNTPSGMQSAQGSDGSYADRGGETGFPKGEVQTVQGSNSFDTHGQNPAQGGGAATGGPK
jgi:hypothetical protein